MSKLMLILVALLSCSCTDAIVMRNPRTGETADCGSHYSYGNAHTIVAAQLSADCVNDYRQQGWQRAPR